ncbi:tetratricopeptide repeat protein [Minwuia sp.]|uniref:tetratricopeptide repeat protein n=1 Tax=Minwuia sp. TaxID=2493630 RepID=UPI003A956370
MTDIHSSIHHALSVMLDVAARPVSSIRLETLFRELSDPSSADLPFEIEDLIWAVWHDHHDREPAELMERVIGHIAARSDDDAEEGLSVLLQRWPDWAEPWNKRATLRFLQGRDAESVADIAETLLREPRHFGALAGFGQICLRNGDDRSAALVFDRALEVNPHMSQIRGLRARLGAGRQEMN